MTDVAQVLLADRRVRPAVPGGPYLVVGLGQAGQAAAEALARLGRAPETVGFDRRPAAVPKRVRRALAALEVEVRLGEEESLLDEVSPGTVVRSPGVPLDSPLLVEAQRRGAVVLDELELGWRLSRAPMIAVTGTNGKTTTASLVSALLEAAGLTAPLAGNADIAPPLSAVPGEPDAIVCEASSFQLEACPALLPEVGMFTNLSADHLTRHVTLRRYAEIKRSLFIKGDSAVPLAVLDAIDGPGARLADEVERAGGRVVRLGQDESAPYRLLETSWDLHRSQLKLQTPYGPLSLQTNLPGLYNARNVALVVALADALGIERSLTSEMLAAHPGARGRFEHLGRAAAGAGGQLILDFASSPDAVEQFLGTLKASLPPGARLHAVVGLLGSPEPRQRRAVGRIAAELCDRLVLTSGSFRSNPPLSGMEEMVTGARGVAGVDLMVVPERKAAIAAGAAGTSSRDVVCVIGRGNVVEIVSGRREDDRSVMSRLTQGGTTPSGPERAPQATGG
ncbi:MAG: Mur ligase family protein [Solirubrobacterales bacterium]